MLTLGNQMTGLPQYLGDAGWLRFEPGQLWAEADPSLTDADTSGNVARRDRRDPRPHHRRRRLPADP